MSDLDATGRHDAAKGHRLRDAIGSHGDASGPCRRIPVRLVTEMFEGVGGIEQSPVTADEGDECRSGLVGQDLGGGEMDGV